MAQESHPRGRARDPGRRPGRLAREELGDRWGVNSDCPREAPAGRARRILWMSFSADVETISTGVVGLSGISIPVPAHAESETAVGLIVWRGRMIGLFSCHAGDRFVSGGVKASEAPPDPWTAGRDSLRGSCRHRGLVEYSGLKLIFHRCADVCSASMSCLREAGERTVQRTDAVKTRLRLPERTYWDHKDRVPSPRFPPRDMEGCRGGIVCPWSPAGGAGP